jgi:hypothetical protein
VCGDEERIVRLHSSYHSNLTRGSALVPGGRDIYVTFVGRRQSAVCPILKREEAPGDPP